MWMNLLTKYDLSVAEDALGRQRVLPRPAAVNHAARRPALLQAERIKHD
jgi:plasmid maintenance system antidote protein VapI